MQFIICVMSHHDIANALADRFSHNVAIAFNTCIHNCGTKLKGRILTLNLKMLKYTTGLSL